MYVSWYVNTVEPPLKENVSIFNTVRYGCIAIIMVNSKRVPPPKGISQVLASPLALDI